jgi:hypothetical protein
MSAVDLATASVSVLQHVRRTDVRTDPFPLVVVRDALPAALCDALIASYPTAATVGADAVASNARWSLPTHAAVGDRDVPELWQRVSAYHASRAFFDEIVDVFGNAIVERYPWAYPDEAALRASRLGIRGADNFDTCDLLMDAQLAGNTPVAVASSVKTVHIDSNKKLITGLFYLRADDDDSEGGDLDIFRFRRDLSPARYARRFNGMFVDESITERVMRVPYARNALVMFVNCPEALHGVTVRNPTPHRRLFMNLVGEVSFKLFDVPQHWQTRAAKLPRLVVKRLRAAAGLS